MTPFLKRWGFGMALALAIAGAASADRFAPAAPHLPAPDVASSPGGAWGCPFVKAAGSSGWIHLANFGDQASRVRVTYLPDRRQPLTQVLELGAGRAGTVGTPAAIRAVAAGAIVEYAGGDVVVSRTAFVTANGGTGGAGASCARPGPQNLVVPDGSTLRVETTLVLLNPGASDAVVDVSLVFDGQELEPESLRGRVVPARGRLTIREGDFAFDEPAVAGVIRARSGRVIAEALVATNGLVDLVPAVGAQTETVAVSHTANGSLFTAVTVGDVEALAEARSLSGAGQGVFEPLVGGLAPNTPRVDGIPENAVPPGPIAVAASSSTSPVALSARWRVIGRGGVSDQAVTSGVPAALRAAAVVGPPAGDLRLLVANPADRDAIVSIVVVTEAGRSTPATLQRVPVEAGSTVELRLIRLGGSGSVGVSLEAVGAPIAAAIEAIATQPSFGVYAISAVPTRTSPVVAVDPDPRAGVPA